MRFKLLFDTLIVLGGFAKVINLMIFHCDRAYIYDSTHFFVVFLILGLHRHAIKKNNSKTIQ